MLHFTGISHGGMVLLKSLWTIRFSFIPGLHLCALEGKGSCLKTPSILCFLRFSMAQWHATVQLSIWTYQNVTHNIFQVFSGDILGHICRFLIFNLPQLSFQPIQIKGCGFSIHHDVQLILPQGVNKTAPAVRKFAFVSASVRWNRKWWCGTWSILFRFGMNFQDQNYMLRIAPINVTTQRCPKVQFFRRDGTVKHPQHVPIRALSRQNAMHRCNSQGLYNVLFDIVWQAHIRNSCGIALCNFHEWLF